MPELGEWLGRKRNRTDGLRDGEKKDRRSVQKMRRMRIGRRARKRFKAEKEQERIKSRTYKAIQIWEGRRKLRWT